MYNIFWLENLKIRDLSEYLGIDGCIILDWVLGKKCEKLFTGFIYFRIRTSGELL
jgi:hypothetical protein